MRMRPSPSMVTASVTDSVPPTVPPAPSPPSSRMVPLRLSSKMMVSMPELPLAKRPPRGAKLPRRRRRPRRERRDQTSASTRRRRYRRCWSRYWRRQERRRGLPPARRACSAAVLASVQRRVRHNALSAMVWTGPPLSLSAPASTSPPPMSTVGQIPSAEAALTTPCCRRIAPRADDAAAGKVSVGEGDRDLVVGRRIVAEHDRVDESWLSAASDAAAVWWPRCCR